MFKKLAVCAVLALGVASAATYNVTLIQKSVVKGTELKPGEYRMNVENGKVTFTKGKQKVETQAQVQTADKKYDSTSIVYAGDSIREICIGGAKTKLVFSN